MNAVVHRVPIFMLTGFLGSGKTTLLIELLKAPAFANTAVTVNELGEIGLDHFLIERSSDSVVLLDAGCLCCTIADSLHETLADLYSRRSRGDIPAFNRVIAETTGLADPAPIINTLLGNRLVTDHYRLDGVVVTVDAEHAVFELAAHPEAAKQIAVADRLVVTKLDLVPLHGELLARLKELNPGAVILESPATGVALEAFVPVDRHRLGNFPVARAAGARGYLRNAKGHDVHIRAHSFVVEDPASWSGIAAWWRIVSDSFGDRLLRCKGIVRIGDTGEIAFLQCVQRVFHKPERLDGWPDADHRSRLVCITRDVDEADLRRTLQALRLPAGADPHISLSELQRM